MNGCDKEVTQFLQEILSGRATVTVRIGGDAVTVSIVALAAAMVTRQCLRDGFDPRSREAMDRTTRSVEDLIAAVRLVVETTASHGVPAGNTVSIVTHDTGRD